MATRAEEPCSGQFTCRAGYGRLCVYLLVRRSRVWKGQTLVAAIVSTTQCSTYRPLLLPNQEAPQRLLGPPSPCIAKHTKHPSLRRARCRRLNNTLQLLRLRCALLQRRRTVAMSTALAANIEDAPPSQHGLQRARLLSRAHAAAPWPRAAVEPAPGQFAESLGNARPRQPHADWLAAPFEIAVRRRPS
jgi:hypothetical protein